MRDAESPTARHGEYLRQRHFGALDGVRGICILAVLWHHAGTPRPWRILQRGFLGVDMFFVLSGFLIVTLLLRERRRSGHISLRAFYMRRTLRIFPIYYGLLAFLALAYGLFKPATDSAGFFSLLPVYLLYVSNWSPLQAANLGIAWSLATEEQFYLLWPAVEKVLRPPYLYVLLLGLLLLNQAINFSLLDSVFAGIYGTEKAPELEILDATFTPICLGVGLAHALHRERAFCWLFRLLGHRHTSLVLALLLLALVSGAPADISTWPRLLIQLLMTALLAALVLRENHSMRLLLTWRPISRTGEISYGMYLLHLWAFHVARWVNEALGWVNPYGLFVTGTVATVAVAEASFRFYEKPFLSLKKHFQRAP